MPRMDGFALVKNIRSDPNLCGLPVIALTSLASPEHIERGLRTGFDSYIIKVDKELLITTIEGLAAKGARCRTSITPHQEG
jgi:two-component system, chemotaxis family, sensor kinase CheA